MGLLTLPFKLPLLPVKGFLRLGELIQEETERQRHDPARIRRELEEAQRQRAAGKISDEELSRAEHAAVARLGMGGTASTGGAAMTGGTPDTGDSDTAGPSRTISGG
jgi:Gas vesicle protein G